MKKQADEAEESKNVQIYVLYKRGSFVEELLFVIKYLMNFSWQAFSFPWVHFIKMVIKKW